MDYERMNDQPLQGGHDATSDDVWLRTHIRAASAVTTSPEFRLQLMQRIQRDAIENTQRLRRVSTFVLWLGITLSAVALYILISMVPSGKQSMVTAATSMHAVLFIGVVTALIAGLAAWEWLDRSA